MGGLNNESQIVFSGRLGLAVARRVSRVVPRIRIAMLNSCEIVSDASSWGLSSLIASSMNLVIAYSMNVSATVEPGGRN